MSPAVADPPKEKFSHEPIEAKDGGTVVVTVNRSESRIKVKWLCGDVRAFTPEAAEAWVDHFDRFKAIGPDIWGEGNDHLGRRFAGRIEKGRFYADARPVENAGHVSWAKLRKAVKAAIREFS